ncbi:MAG: transcriptional regulator NrdR [Anaerococcus sp.]|uniref:Transcriptional repressor NrdR n=1 Tax=Anaerococcus nagyae TaxID=1755241 RepID=A0A3E2TJV6_9FIRM|nr:MULTISPECIES: transcriptional regulator NrdR [Anaerococcus]MDU1864282.1 transcriptional regulator NrdR [Anaerococcus sp.]MDU2353138.1 transcriptional regulator NrdR [Anaerococcus sp.]RGB77290.1 transcriptional repressor NrdR [Anaerococcus nagyae]
MKCPYCHSHNTKVLDSRTTEDDTAIRRRRLCEDCGKRFSTYERYENITLMVVKKDDTREAYDPSKIINGIVKSCQKRPVSMDQIEKVAKDVEIKINHTGKKEVTTNFIGQLVMDELKDLDPVAYVRFASVYREFKDVDSFYEEILNLKDKEDADN